jgi:IS605 OrfB family transposase
VKTKPKAHKLTPKKEAKAFTGVQALLVFPSEEDRRATLDLMRRFSAALRYAYNRLLEGQTREELKRQDGPLCTLFQLNTRHADDATLKAQALLDSARERGEDPRKVVFGGRGRFEQLKRRHLSGKPLKRLKREWRERRQGLLYSRGDRTKGGNPNLRLFVKDGALRLRIGLGDGSYAWAILKTGHPNLNTLVERVYASLPYNVELSLKEGRVHATFTWTEEPPPLTITKENGILALDVNSDPYHLALAVVGRDGNLVRHLTFSLEEVDRAPNRGAKELVLWKVAHRVVAVAEEHGVAIATERLKHLRKSRRGDGTGRAFRRKEHRFAYASLLRKVHSLARKRGVQVVEVNPQDTSTMGMLKYAPQLSLSKDVAAAYVIGRRALGFKEKLPKGYKALLSDRSFLAHAEGFHRSRLQELQKLREAEGNPHLKRRLSREMGRAKRHLSMLSSLQGSPGSQEGSTEGRNPFGANPWRVLRVGTFLPLLGRAVPRDLSPLKVVLHRGAWEGWKGSLGPHPGGGPGCANVHFG